MNMLIISLGVIIVMHVLFLFYAFFQLYRNEMVYQIRTRWIDNHDKRIYKYTYDEMMTPSASNNYGFQIPKEHMF